jgi:hypothetical protein
VRRRLSDAEEMAVGPAVDVRGTDESAARIRRVRTLAPYVPAALLLEES